MPDTSGQAELLFKVSLGAADTGPTRAGGTKQFFEEALSSRPVVFGTSVWSDVGDIPIPAPSLSHNETSGVVKYFEDVAFLPLEGQAHPVTGFPLPDASNAFFLNDLIDAIPFNFEPSGSYGYALKKASGDPIYPGDGDWVVDIASGVLNFYGNLPNGVTLADPPTISFYKYVGEKGGGGGGASITISATAPPDSEAGALWWNSDTGDLLLRYQDTDSAQWVSAIGGAGGFFELNSATNTISTPYNLTAPSKNFRIPHPLPSLSDDYILMHTSVEAPEATLLYRGRVQLTNGRATVNIDEHSRMTEGTFVALSHNPNCHISNNVDWTPVRGRVEGNILTIEAKESDCNVEVEWLVTCARRDPEIYKLPAMDVDGVYHPEVSKVTLAPEPKQHIDPIKLEFGE